MSEHDDTARQDMGLTLATLPIELSSYIFTLCLPDEKYITPSGLTAPLLLTRISRAWRSIALNTPELWSSLHIGLRNSQWVWNAKCVVEEWLARSGSRPLALSLACESTDHSEVSELINLILSYTPRCACLSLRLNASFHLLNIRVIHGAYPVDLLDLHKIKRLPLLQELDLDLPFINQADIIRFFVRSAPPLRAITLSGFPCSLLRFDAALYSLVSLHSNASESVSDCVEILRLAPMLRECTFELHAKDDEEFWHEEGISADEDSIHNRLLHTNLRKLFVGPSNLAHFFDKVTLPALQDLTIDGHPSMSYEWGDFDDFDASFTTSPIVYEAIWDQGVFESFVCRSSCEITRLRLYGLQLRSVELIKCLEAVSHTLVELHVEGGTYKMIDASVVDALTLPGKRSSAEPDAHRLGDDNSNDDRPHQQRLCPSLERLCMTGYIFAPSGTGGKMADMIESRLRLADSDDRAMSESCEGLGRRGQQLRWVCMGGAFDRKDRERIASFRSVGLEFHYVEGHYRH